MRSCSKAVAIAETLKKARRAKVQNGTSHRSALMFSLLLVLWAPLCYSSPMGAPPPGAASPIKSTPLGLWAPFSKEAQGASLLVQKWVLSLALPFQILRISASLSKCTQMPSDGLAVWFIECYFWAGTSHLSHSPFEWPLSISYMALG